MRVEGDGVHEIAVGPVHAGIIEPGHFRFSVVGEKVLRLEERLGYTHKGIEKRFTATARRWKGHRLAGRVSGDTTVAYAWAYCMALESAAGCEIRAERAQWLRALLLERERVANHLGDLGALGNDAALGVGAGAVLAAEGGLAAPVVRGVRPSLHDGLRGARAAWRVDIDAAAAGRLARQCDAIEARVAVAARDLRRACGPAGPLCRHRPRQRRARGATRADGPGRPCQRPAPATCAATIRGRRTTRSRSRSRRIAQPATWPRAWPCASTRPSNRCG